MAKKAVKSKKTAKKAPAKKKAASKKGTPKEKKKEFTPLNFLTKKDAKDVETYTEAVVKKFGKYIKSMCVGGSTKTGKGKKKTSDIDIAIIVDDTDVRRMTRIELKEKLFQRLCEMGFPISKKIHPQPYLLTEFWEYVREGNPVIYNLVLRDSVILFDTGFLLPMQMLLTMGKIKPSKEAVDKHMFVAKELMALTKKTILSKLVYNLEQCIVSSTQAVLMELGYRPPAPRAVPDFAKDFLMKERKLITQEYVDIATRAIDTYKAIEHKEKKDITADEFDKMMKDTQKYVKKMESILKKLREKSGEKWLFEVYEKASGVEVKRDGMVSIKDTKVDTEKATKLIEEGLGQR
jgi:predicted nucleotidyltransferase